MKIAIFGDSFGVNMNHYNQTLSWVDIVKADYDVTNFCEGGSSLYYQYELFKENHMNYDKVFFLITNSGRLYLKDCKIQKHVSHYETAKHWSLKSELLQDKSILTAAIQYFLYLQNVKFDDLVQNLILKEIQLERLDLLLIPCFEGYLKSFNNSLMKACLVDWQYYNISHAESLIDKRHCHMNEPDNKILADEILHYLKTDEFDFDNCNWVVDNKPLDCYFE
jgi:hypothetical protein